MRCQVASRRLRRDALRSPLRRWLIAGRGRGTASTRPMRADLDRTHTRPSHRRCSSGSPVQFVNHSRRTESHHYRLAIRTGTSGGSSGADTGRRRLTSDPASSSFPCQSRHHLRAQCGWVLRRRPDVGRLCQARLQARRGPGLAGRRGRSRPDRAGLAGDEESTETGAGISGRRKSTEDRAEFADLRDGSATSMACGMEAGVPRWAVSDHCRVHHDHGDDDDDAHRIEGLPGGEEGRATAAHGFHFAVGAA